MPSIVVALRIILVVLLASLGVTFFVAPITAMTGVEAFIETVLAGITLIAQALVRRAAARAVRQ